ncbi:28S ribosomal protein S6, mitochondrial-like [Acanthaster planci]|uniref:Small ribosomal subunit protein bS6m n=1 Tax=Acanthaster planci TaxID=133434 RepID=A0A8B7XP58_ACAPL|nr:28S ribosomal protein S6, mitochondrial-like [Acanthaster planci]
MPGYEMALIMRVMKRSDLIEAVKRSVGAVIEQGGIVKKLENLGEKRLPYQMNVHAQKFTRGHYFVLEFDSPPNTLASLQEYLHRDVDVIKPTILNRETETREPPPCPGPYTGRYSTPEKSVRNPGKIRRDVKLDDLSK